MESSREAARTAIEDAIARLKEVVPGVSLNAPLTLHAVTPYSQTMQSTFGREVTYSKIKKKDMKNRSDVALFSFCSFGSQVYTPFITGRWYGLRLYLSVPFEVDIFVTGRFASSQENRSVGGLD